MSKRSIATAAAAIVVLSMVAVSPAEARLGTCSCTLCAPPYDQTTEPLSCFAAETGSWGPCDLYWYLFCKLSASEDRLDAMSCIDTEAAGPSSPVIEAREEVATPDASRVSVIDRIEAEGTTVDGASD